MTLHRPPTLRLPDSLEEHQLVASVSGGKDSTAMLLALRESDLPFRAVFADTGWESPLTYAHLDALRERLGVPIDVVEQTGVKRQWVEDVLLLLGLDAKWADSAMVRGFVWRAGFPARQQRWCTRELKIEPIRDYHAKLDAKGHGPTAVVVGVRAEESEARADLAELDQEAEGPNGWGWWVWRPLIRWSIDEVLAIHARHDVPVNPLYRLGFSRVGCFPCIYARKEEIRLIAELYPERIEEIAIIEEVITRLREVRNGARPGRYASPRATFFQARTTTGPMPSIRTIADWAATSRGGRQLQLLPVQREGGCYSWGLCEPAVDETDLPSEETP